MKNWHACSEPGAPCTRAPFTGPTGPRAAVSSAAGARAALALATPAVTT